MSYALTYAPPRGIFFRPAAPGLVLALILLFAGCAEERSTTPKLTEDQCVSCHTDKDRLIATAFPDTAEVPENPGEG